jgi:hypothetical protein
MTKGEFNLKLLQKHFEENEGKILRADFDEIKVFQNKYNVEIPLDLQNYYLKLNGSGDAILNNLYEFYSIRRTKKTSEELINWKGFPDYSKLNFEGIENVFVFGEYQFNLYVFGIELHQDMSLNNRIFILCGEDFKIIADSFQNLSIYIYRLSKLFA